MLPAPIPTTALDGPTARQQSDGEWSRAQPRRLRRCSENRRPGVLPLPTALHRLLKTAAENRRAPMLSRSSCSRRQRGDRPGRAYRKLPQPRAHMAVRRCGRRNLTLTRPRPRLP